MSQSVSAAEAKARLSELLGRVNIGKERFVIEKHGKPVGAIVSMDDLARLESENSSSKSWVQAALETNGEMDDFATIMEEVVRERQFSRDREVSLD